MRKSKDGRTPHTARLVLLAVLVVQLAACSATRMPSEPRRSPVLVLTIDCLRPDHLSTYGYERDTSPALTALAQDSVLFRNAFTAGGWTSPGLVSLYSASFPSEHGVVARDRSAPDDLPTPLKTLRAAGYRVPDLFRFQHVENYHHLGFEPMATETADPANIQRWIGEHSSQPFFVAHHLRTVHLPYDPPPPHDQYFRDALAESGKSDLSSGLTAVRSKLRVYVDSVEFEEGDKVLVDALYDGVIRTQDEEVGAILDDLKKLGIYNDLFLIVTADHGEQLLEHGFVGHASTSLDGKLYDEVMRVPLLIKFPRQQYAGRQIESLVRTVDVLPTVLDVLGLDDGSNFSGRSLLPLIRGDQNAKSEVAIAETSSCGWTCPPGEIERYLRAVRTDSYKLIESREDDGVTYELYDLQADPGETTNILESEPGVAARLQTFLPASTPQPSR